MTDRRSILRTATFGALGSMLPGLLSGQKALAQTIFATPPAIVPARVRIERLVRVSVCSRPARISGPRVERETIGDRIVVHNYGHGGSGWSLSWGSAMEAVPLVMETGSREIAVVGAGVLGLTAALTAQRMGLKVTIYAKDRFPFVRSSRASAYFGPNGHVIMNSHVTDAFVARWTTMARNGFIMHSSYLGMADDPVDWVDRYTLSDTPFDAAPRPAPRQLILPGGTTDSYWSGGGNALGELVSGFEELTSGSHPFHVPHVRRSMMMRFNVADYMRKLEADFLAGGGSFAHIELHGPADFTRIPQKAIINSTGYGARALMRDDTVLASRGQIAWLAPQPDYNCGVFYKGLTVFGRRDGICVQYSADDDIAGFNNPSEEPDYEAAKAAVGRAAEIFQPKTAS